MANLISVTVFGNLDSSLRPFGLFMKKGATTKLSIIQQAAPIFNQQGYAGTSIKDVMQATGLQKGGIYNHFESKEHLAIESFNYSVREVRRHYAAALSAKESAQKQLLAFIDNFTNAFENPPIPGGCPLLNAAIESDDELPIIRVQVRRAMKNWHYWIARIIKGGISKGELNQATDPKAAATLFIACLEGGLMLSKLHDDLTYLQQSATHLHHYIKFDLSP